MTRPLFQGEAKLVPFHFQMNDLHQKFKLNFDTHFNQKNELSILGNGRFEIN